MTFAKKLRQETLFKIIYDFLKIIVFMKNLILCVCTYKQIVIGKMKKRRLPWECLVWTQP